MTILNILKKWEPNEIEFMKIGSNNVFKALKFFQQQLDGIP